jgi:hypothetical protein
MMHRKDGRSSLQCGQFRTTSLWPTNCLDRLLRTQKTSGRDAYTSQPKKRARHNDAIIFEVAAIVWSANTLLMGFIL